MDRPLIEVKCNQCGDDGLVAYERKGCEYVAHCACKAGARAKVKYPWTVPVHLTPAFDPKKLPAGQLGMEIEFPKEEGA